MPESKDPAFERVTFGDFWPSPYLCHPGPYSCHGLPKEPALSLPKEPALSLPKGVSRCESSVFGLLLRLCKDFLQVGLTVEAQRFSAANQHHNYELSS
jgi:hypothetical protein